MQFAGLIASKFASRLSHRTKSFCFNALMRQGADFHRVPRARKVDGPALLAFAPLCFPRPVPLGPGLMAQGLQTAIVKGGPPVSGPRRGGGAGLRAHPAGADPGV